MKIKNNKMAEKEDNKTFTPFMHTAFRVSDVDRAIEFYGKFGFKNTYSVPGELNETLICFLEYGGHILIVARLKGLPYPMTPRESAIQEGPRGLGTKISFNVADLDFAYELCISEKCEITMEPMEELWGDRIFTCLDPFGYELQIHQNVKKYMNEDDLTKAYQSVWLDEKNKV
ncbi:MAG: VOC family protein [Weeksellaceae bacterium]|jgi:uncharacterized glyoxalase superfamily protein PhnB|nr:VOC family protein [Weeksellaceae bacterium]